MLRKNIVTGTGVDRQDQQILLPALMEYVDQFNNSDTVPRMSLNHDRTLLPIGKVISGELISRDGEVLLEATIDDFIGEFEPCVGPNGEKLYIGKSSADSRPFAEESALSDAQLTLKLNPIHFSKEDFAEVTEYLQNQCDTQVDTIIEKELDPTIQFIFVFAAGYLVKTLAPKVKEKTADKLSDVISDDVVNGYELLKKAITYVTKKILSVGQKVYVFTEPEQPVEFVVKARTADEVLDAFSKLSEFDYLSVVERFKHYTNDNLEKIQFLFDSFNGKWEMTYLTTKDGQVIGTKANYEKAVVMYKKIMESHIAGFSISGSAIFNDSECDENA